MSSSFAVPTPRTVLEMIPKIQLIFCSVAKSPQIISSSSGMSLAAGKSQYPGAKWSSNFSHHVRYVSRACIMSTGDVHFVRIWPLVKLAYLVADSGLVKLTAGTCEEVFGIATLHNLAGQEAHAALKHEHFSTKIPKFVHGTYQHDLYTSGKALKSIDNYESVDILTSPPQQSTASKQFILYLDTLGYPKPPGCEMRSLALYSDSMNMSSTNAVLLIPPTASHRVVKPQRFWDI